MAKSMSESLLALASGEMSSSSRAALFKAGETELYFERIGKVVVNNIFGYNKKLYVKFVENDDKIAWTDGDTFYINFTSQFFDKSSSNAQLMSICLGTMVHEICHIMWTNFDNWQTWLNGVNNHSTIFLKEPVRFDFCSEEWNEKKKELLSFLSKSSISLRKFFKLASSIDNSLEDGFIEKNFLSYSYGVCNHHLMSLRKYQTENSFENMETDDTFECLCNLILGYAKYEKNFADGTNIGGELKKLMPAIDDITQEKNSNVRFDKSVAFTIDLFDWYKTYLTDEENVPKDILSNPQMGQGKGEDNDFDGNAKMKKKQENKENALGGQNSTANSRGESESDFDEDNSLEEVIKTIAKKEIEEQKRENAEKNRLKTYQQIMSKQNKNSTHRNVKYTIKQPKKGDRVRYEKLCTGELKPAIDKTRKYLESKLQKYKSSLLRGRRTGSRVDINSFVNDRYSPFVKQTLPKEFDTSVCILIDESTSMSLGKRWIMARNAAIVTYEALSGIGIPTSILGHSSNYPNQTIDSFIDFSSKSNDNDKYRLLSMDTRGCTRDGAALLYCITRLNERKERRKLLFIISDGLPCDNNYYGEPAKEDIQNIVQNAKKQKIEVIAFGIGKDGKRLLDIYGQRRYVDISDISSIPTNIARIVGNN